MIKIKLLPRQPFLHLSVMHKRFALLLILFGIFTAPVFTADAQETLDIPADESSEESTDEVVEQDAIPEPPKLKKRDAEKEKEKEQIPVVDSEEAIESNMVVLQGLNKVLGRVSTLEIPLGTLARFENLEIIARKCQKSSPDEQPENAALLEILEVKAGEEPKQIFLGWMFSSSPGLSGLEHPVYDVTVLSCDFRTDLEIN